MDELLGAEAAIESKRRERAKSYLDIAETFDGREDRP